MEMFVDWACGFEDEDKELLEVLPDWSEVLPGSQGESGKVKADLDM